MLLLPSDWLAATAFLVLQFAAPYVNVNRREYEAGSRYVLGSPPAWLFGPVWIVLRLLRGFSTFLYWRNALPSGVYDWILALSIATLILDYQWTPIFFGVKQSGAALVIVMLNVITATATLSLLGVDAAWLPFGLLAPYPLWLLYATYLNFSWWLLGIWARVSVAPR
jgi:tryptophan-rich sensory protein